MHNGFPECRRAYAGALLLWVFGAIVSAAGAQSNDPDRGLSHVDPRWHALVGATVIPRPGDRIENATVIVRDGVIVSVREGTSPPPGARVWDYSGNTIYAGLIEPFLQVEVPLPAESDQGLHWSGSQVVPQRSALDGSGPDEEARKSLRSLGFSTAAIVPEGGVISGRVAVVSLGDEPGELESSEARVIRSDVFQSMSFQRSFGRGGGSGPGSEMGMIALVRQSLLDAERYQECWEVYHRDPKRHEPPMINDALAALTASSSPRFLFDASSELQMIRAQRIAEEFSRDIVFLGTGSEYQRLDDLRKLGLPIIVPLNFPDPPEVETLSKSEQVSLQELMAWEQAPTNLRRLDQAGMSVVLTTHRLESRDQFFKNLEIAIDHGLAWERALAFMTTEPAKLLGLEERLGQVASGMIANMVVVEGEPFSSDAVIREVWIGGRRHLIEPKKNKPIDGRWSFSIDVEETAKSLTLVVDDESVRVKRGEDSFEGSKVNIEENRLECIVDGSAFDDIGMALLSCHLEDDNLFGSVRRPDGTRQSWMGTRTPESEDETKDEETETPDKPSSEAVTEDSPIVANSESKADETEANSEDDKNEKKAKEKAAIAQIPEEIPTPFGAFGFFEMPEQDDVIIENATIWTCADDESVGIIENGTMVVSKGKILYVGVARSAPALDDARRIDAAGKHLTPGIIDCHSHTGISGGVNEGWQRVTAEVRIADVINPDSISWYRQLAGGLTAANQLHGSANAIGGQNSVVKARWGSSHPDAFPVSHATPGIKFALGENPKRVAASNDSDDYPQTRMGVETLIRDRLIAGKDYAAEWARYEALSESERALTMPPRRDLELEALAEIVLGKRLIHCHSYRQDEILMLAKLAQEMGFTIGTFQHVLEGYKVAEAVRDSALGGSTFSDWWAYKFEVIDAIPENASIMTEVGVCVSINSDSDEHARRLNTEAAKAVKYGGMAPHEALKMVTLNPAKQLQVDDRMGSLEAGKDADFAVWSGSPLSYYSLCERTFVDGRELYSLEQDARHRADAALERERLIQKLLATPSRKKREGGDRKGPVTEPSSQIQHWELHMEMLLRAGYDPNLAVPGDCGCGELLLMQSMKKY